jgi:hypothetical protein
MPLDLLLAIHTASTLFMTGLIWFVQVVHYPLFVWVGGGSFAVYESQHTRRTTFVVGPVMLIELGSALCLLGFQPPGSPHWAVWGGVVLLAVIWLTTFFVSVPCHRRLSKGLDAGVVRRLVRSNWVRTSAWSLRAVLALVIAFAWTR